MTSQVFCHVRRHSARFERAISIPFCRVLVTIVFIRSSGYNGQDDKQKPMYGVFMIDLNRLREETEKVKKLILLKEPGFDIDRLIELDRATRETKISVETLRKNKNDLAALGAKGATPEIREKAIELGKQLKTLETDLALLEKDFND